MQPQNVFICAATELSQPSADETGLGGSRVLQVCTLHNVMRANDRLQFLGKSCNIAGNYWTKVMIATYGDKWENTCYNMQAL